MKRKNTRSRMYGGVDASLREEDRRKRLIEAGLEAFGTKGYAKTNIKTLCGLAGLTERYFYESFRSKEELLLAVYREIVGETWHDAVVILEDRSLSPLEASEKALRIFYQRFLHDPRKAQAQFFEVLGVSPVVDTEYREAMRLLAEMLKLFLMRVFPDLKKEKLNRSIIPTGLAGAMIMISHEWYLGGFQTPLDDIIEESMDFLMAFGRHLEAGSSKRRVSRTARPKVRERKPRA
ncbi:TetR/AcrR family transcriptional regulator [bacterium]|nr:TetR/AcrR family transcriptional regulator [bacterium]